MNNVVLDANGYVSSEQHWIGIEQWNALMAERDRLRASFDAHHPANLQEGFRCNVCGEDHPHAGSGRSKE